MEITSPCLKPLHHQHQHLHCSSNNIYNNIKKFKPPSKYNYCCSINNSLITQSNHSPPNSPIQIHLPLQQRPTRKYQVITPLNTSNSSWWKTTNTNTNTAAAAATTTTTAADVLRLMDILGLPIPIDIYISLIKEITSTQDATGATKLHTHIQRSGLRPCLPLINRILLMYITCGLIGDARNVFDKMTVKDSNTWAIMIWGYTENDVYEEAIYLFVLMQHRCNYEILDFPISWIVVCVIKSCINTMNLGLGKQIHGWLLKLGLGRCMDLFISSSLISLYGKFGCLEFADFVFDHLSRRNYVTWTSKIVNNCREERFNEVIDDFKEMGREGIKKNGFTFSSVLRACGRMRDGGQFGKQVHANALKMGLELDTYVHCGLVDMYGKCGLLEDARRVFEVIGENRNSACWNAMINNYIQHGFCIEAIKFLYQMKAAGLESQESLINEVRFTCGSKAFDSKSEETC